MADAIDYQVRAAVVAQISSRTYSLSPATCAATEDATEELGDAAAEGLHIDVILVGHKLVALARDEKARDPVIQVLIRKRFTNAAIASDAAEQKALAKFVEEIEDDFFDQYLARMAGANCQDCQMTGGYIKSYATTRQFIAILSMTFHVADY